jgi:hypothetical protein
MTAEHVPGWHGFDMGRDGDRIGLLMYRLTLAQLTDSNHGCENMLAEFMDCPDCTARVILGLAALAAFMSTEVYGDGEKATTAHPVRTNHRRSSAY